MEPKEIIKKALDDYHRITGLRSYVIDDETEVQSASEKNYFCKCLKISGKALKMCEQCNYENYNDARTLDDVRTYSCHARLIKWAFPVHRDDFHCVIMSEGILGQKQFEEANSWAKDLANIFELNEEMLLRNFKAIQTMDESQMNASMSLLKELIAYYFTMEEDK